MKTSYGAKAAAAGVAKATLKTAFAKAKARKSPTKLNGKSVRANYYIHDVNTVSQFSNYSKMVDTTQKTNKYAVHIVVIRNQGGVCTVQVITYANGMKKPYTYHYFELELYKEGSELRTKLNFIMSVLRCQDGTTIPCVDERGFFFKDFVFELPDTTEELYNLLKQICAWLNAPENNKYNRQFIVGDIWDITPESGPPKLGSMLTPRDTCAFLTHVFGQENDAGVVALPENWATENAETLDIFVDEMSTELARELGVDMNGRNLNLPDDENPDAEETNHEEDQPNDENENEDMQNDENPPNEDDLETEDVDITDTQLDDVTVKSESDDTKDVFQDTTNTQA